MKILTFLFLILTTQAIAQEKSDPVQLLRENAIPIENLTQLNKDIYQEISGYDVIMVGEMHGTREPANFVFGLCELIADREDRVILALEIPGYLMSGYSQNITEERLRELEFFQSENSDGRNGQAWLELIANCNKNDKVQIQFIDNNLIAPRDSSMYMDLLEIRRVHPETKIVTLTGNIHNWLKPFRGKLKLGGYLMKDSKNFGPDRIMSINHIYKQGTMMNNMGNGLELKTIKGKETFFNTTIESKMYLCKRIMDRQDQYTHFLFTENVTHSEVLK